MTTTTKLNLSKNNLDKHFVISRGEVQMINQLVSSIHKQVEVLNDLLAVTGLVETYGNDHPRKISNLDIPVIVKD